MCFTYLSSINSQAHACIYLIRIYLLLFILGMAFFYSWAVLSLLASHILPTDLSVCDPSLLHQIAAQAYVCNLIQPCSTNLYTYACLLPHVLVFIPWGIHMHGSIAAQAVFPAWWYHLLSVWGVCCACPTPTVYAWGPLNTTELLSFPLHVYCHSHCLLKLQTNSDFIALCCILTHVYAPMCAWDIYIWCVFNSG